MSYLTDRVERAILAALLQDPHPPQDFYGLNRDEFGSRLHREVFTALTDLATTHPDLDLAERDRLIVERLHQPALALEDLDTWRAEAVDASAIASYAQLVLAGAVYRDLAEQAHRAAQHVAVNQAGLDPALAEHERKLAAALERHAQAFAAIHEVDAGYPVDIHVTTAPANARAALEDQVLAHLLREPEQIPVLREFLTDNAFTSSLRRHLYRAMLTMDNDGELIDELTLTWRIEVDLAHARLHGTDVNAPGSTPDESVYPLTDIDPAPAPTYLAYLATTQTTHPSPVHAGRELLTWHMRDILPNPAATATAILAHREQTLGATQQVTGQTTTVTRTNAAVRTQQIQTTQAYSSARPPGPLPASGPEPQPGQAPTSAPSIQPGVRP